LGPNPDFQFYDYLIRLSIFVLQVRIKSRNELKWAPIAQKIEAVQTICLHILSYGIGYLWFYGQKLHCLTNVRKT